MSDEVKDVLHVKELLVGSISGDGNVGIEVGNTIDMGNSRNIEFGTATGGKIGTATGEKLCFWGVTPVVQQVLATGGGATVDNVISLLQTLGLCKQA